MPLTLNVNGRDRAVEADPETPLLYVLRNDLGLLGTKFGCGTGFCGACMVTLEGRAIRSCDIPVAAVVGRRIETVESLATDGALHPLQQAFIDEQAMQCGYCVSGILMSAKALLDATPRPSRDEIRSALEPNLCRCGSQPRMVRAVERAAAPR